MIFLAAIAWYIVGLFLVWRLLIRIDPVFTDRDVIPALFAGLFGPLILLWYPFYWFSSPSRPPKKISWLSGNQ